MALDAGTSDWCLWLDTDECLVGAEALGKYLRNNCFYGYVIRQHYFSCEGPSQRTYQFDCSVAELAGANVKILGAIHEQPEFGLNEGCIPSIGLVM